MKQRAELVTSDDAPLTELTATFAVLYSLLLDRIEAEPEKGMVIQKGKPNQYKLKWKRAMYCLHELEDYFILRDPDHCAAICKRCIHWHSVSAQSPHLGKCNKRNKKLVHALSHCKYMEGQK